MSYAHNMEDIVCSTLGAMLLIPLLTGKMIFPGKYQLSFFIVDKNKNPVLFWKLMILTGILFVISLWIRFNITDSAIYKLTGG
jgi:lipid-A-disaccharide synthase-like uncharacterized protein